MILQNIIQGLFVVRWKQHEEIGVQYESDLVWLGAIRWNKVPLTNRHLRVFIEEENDKFQTEQV
jgi:hypothetical protein